MRLSALDCVGHAAKSVRANWQLILATWVGGLVVAILTLLGFVPPLLLAGWESGHLFDGQELQLLARAAWEQLAQLSPAVLTALTATALLWLLAFIVYCFFQAGLYGVLVAAEQQAGATVSAPWALFRTFSWQHFFGWGGRYLWRFFWFLNLCLVALLTLSLLLIVWMLLAVVGADRWGASAAAAIGCGGAVPLAFLLLVAMAWFYLGQAHLARESSGVWEAGIRALQVLGRRLGAVLLIAVVFLVTAMALGATFFPVVLMVEVALAGRGLVSHLANGLLSLIESVATSALTLLLAASLVALLQGELRAGRAM